MRKSKKIASEFGMTQEEMAMMLGISRSLWSMYELGRRSLPADKMLLLEQARTHLENQKTAKKSKPQQLEQEQGRLEILEKLWQKNEYERKLLAKNVFALERKREAAQQRTQLVEYLKQQKDSGKGDAGKMFIPAKAKAYKNPGRDVGALLVEYEIARKTLEFQKDLIESELKKITPKQPAKK